MLNFDFINFVEFIIYNSMLHCVSHMQSGAEEETRIVQLAPVHTMQHTEYI